MTRTTMGNLINLSVNITRVTTDLLERFALEFISEKKLVVSDIENCTLSSSEDRPAIFFEDEDRPLFI